MHSTTPRRHGQTLTILTAPHFEPDQAQHGIPPPRDAPIWRISLSPAAAFKLLCDIGHLYPGPHWRPRAGGMLERDGAITLYLWPKVDPDSRLLMLMLDYGAARLCDASRWTGEAWISGDLLYRVLAALAMRDHWRMTADPRLLADERPGYLLSLERQVAR